MRTRLLLLCGLGLGCGGGGAVSDTDAGSSLDDGSVQDGTARPDAAGPTDAGAPVDAFEPDSTESDAQLPPDAVDDSHVPLGRSCSVRGLTVPDGDGVQLFTASRAAVGDDCSDFRERRVCNDGVLQGDVTATSVLCVPRPAAYPLRRSWYYDWNGAGNPNHPGLPHSLWLDVPHGDDYDEYIDPVENCREHYDTPSRGFFTIDLIKTPSGATCPLTRRGQNSRGFTGFIQKRDPVFDNEVGYTVEFNIRLLEHNRRIQNDAVALQINNTYGNIGVAFSWDCTKAGPDALRAESRHECLSVGNYQAVATDNVVAATYRVVAHPQSVDFDLYRNNVLVASATGGSAPDSRHEAPVPPGTSRTSPNNLARDGSFLSLGDPADADEEEIANGTDYSGAFVLDFLRFSPGEYTSGNTPPPMNHPHTVAALPNPSTVAGSYHELNFDSSQASGYVEAGLTITMPSLDQAHALNFDEVTASEMSLDATRSSLFVVTKPTSIVGNDGWEVQVELRTGDAHEERAFGMLVMDRTGVSEVLFSRDKVELRIGKTFHSYALPAFLDTSQYHVYRLLKTRGSTNVSLYLDENPIALAEHLRTGMSQLNLSHGEAESSALQMQINLGNATLLPTDIATSFGASYTSNSDVEVRALRWRRFPLVDY